MRGEMQMFPDPSYLSVELEARLVILTYTLVFWSWIHLVQQPRWRAHW